MSVLSLSAYYRVDSPTQQGGTLCTQRERNFYLGPSARAVCLAVAGISVWPPGLLGTLVGLRSSLLFRPFFKRSSKVEGEPARGA